MSYNLKLNHSLSSWIQFLSFGRLIKPTSDWLMSRYVTKFHMQKESNRLAELICKMKHIPKDLVTALIKLRIIIQINYLKRNRKIKCTRKRKKENFNQRQSKKMRKIICIVLMNIDVDVSNFEEKHLIKNIKITVYQACLMT